MFCPQCGSELADGAKIRPKCGAPVGAGETSQKAAEPDASLDAATSTGSPSVKPKRKGPVFWILAIGVPVVIVVAFVARRALRRAV